MADLYDVPAELADERRRQDEKWGEQNHPDIDDLVYYEFPTAHRARELCENAARRGKVTWAHILLEELAEAGDAAMASQTALKPLRPEYVTQLRAELIQVAAVAVAWVECLDRRTVGTDRG